MALQSECCYAPGTNYKSSSPVIGRCESCCNKHFCACWQWAHPPEQQVEALVQACLALLKRNLVQPFSLTLLNVGATNFCATAVRGQGMPKAFSRLLSRPAATPSDNSTGAYESAGKLLLACCSPVKYLVVNLYVACCRIDVD